jgi:hypothetical protein
LVRYENLLARPIEELKRVCSLVGADPPASRLEEIVESRSYGQVSPGERGSGRFVRRAEPGGWRETMDERERSAMHEILGPKLDELGYLRDREALPAEGALPHAS